MLMGGEEVGFCLWFWSAKTANAHGPAPCLVHRAYWSGQAARGSAERTWRLERGGRRLLVRTLVHWTGTAARGLAQSPVVGGENMVVGERQSEVAGSNPCTNCSERAARGSTQSLVVKGENVADGESGGWRSTL